MVSASINSSAGRPISICFIALEAYPLFSRVEKGAQGGAEVDIYMLSTELAKDKKFSVSMITGDYGQREVERFDGVVIYKTSDLQNPVAAFLSMWKTMKLVNSDVYFKKGASSIAGLVALFCRTHGRQFFLRTSHDIDCDGTYLRQNWLRGRVFLWAIRRAKLVSVQKESDSEPLRKTTGVSSISIPNGHRIPEQSAHNRDSIIWVGRSVDFKQPYLFIKLAQEIPSEKFVMICQQTKGDNKYGELVARAKSVANLEFIEGVPFHEIDDFFRRARIFVSTSSAEGFANTFVQACKCATPILSLNVNPDGFLDKFNCGLCANGDWHKFREMLKRLLEPEIAVQYGANGWRYANENHNIEKIVQRYKELFMQIVHNGC